MNIALRVETYLSKELPEAYKEDLFELFYSQVKLEFALADYHLSDEDKQDLKQSTRECMETTETYILCFSGDEMVGFIASEIDKPTTISSLFVKETYRRRGVGTILVKEFSKRLDRHPIEVVCLTDNECAMLFYAKRGFVFEKKNSIVSEGVGVIY